MGNTRVGFRAAGGPSNGNQLVKTSETAFDPWGVILRGAGQVNGITNRFEFLNREKESTFNLNSIRLGARGYNPTIGRFDRVDPKPDVEGQESLSTYQYGANNPILLSDPNGDCAKCWEAIKSWFNAPISPLAQETGKAYMQSMTGRDITPTTQGEFMLASIGFASQRFGGSLPGSNKIRIPRGNKTVAIETEGGALITTDITRAERALAKPGEDLFVGSYGKSYRANVKSGLNATHTPHHVVQDAVSTVSHSKGVTINLRKDLHEMTATFKRPIRDITNSGIVNPQRAHLNADVRELRPLLLNNGYERQTVNTQLLELIKQNKDLGGFQK